MSSTTNSLIAIVGPTAVGKTKLSVGLAKDLNTEVISVDSLQCYKPGSIVTAKVEPEEAEGVPHHLVDYLEAHEEPQDFIKQALSCIESLQSLGKVPILVGGSTSLTIPLLEATVERGTRVFVILLTSPGPIHKRRICSRIDEMIDRGLLEELEELRLLEIQHLGGTPDFTRGIWKTIGYPELYPYLTSQEDPNSERQQLLEKGMAQFGKNTILYAQMQQEWMRKNLIPFLQKSQIPITTITVETANDLVSGKEEALSSFVEFMKEGPLMELGAECASVLV